MIGKRVKFTKTNIDWELSNDNKSTYTGGERFEEGEYSKNIMAVLYQLLFPDEYPGVIVGQGGTSDTVKVKFNFGFTSYYETKDLKFEKEVK